MSLPRTLFIVIFSLLPAVARAQAPAPVTIEQARLDTFSASSWVPGTVISRNDARIGAETGGRVTWVAEVGDFVHAGTPLARVDDTDLQLELADNEARLESLLAQQRYQVNNLGRLEELGSRNNAAANQVDEARAQLDMAEQEIQRARIAASISGETVLPAAARIAVLRAIAFSSKSGLPASFHSFGLMRLPSVG